MNTICTSLLAGLALCATGPLFAQNAVTNGDFSVDATLFSTFPGYVGGANPADIPNWTKSVGGLGVNGSLGGMHQPFGPVDKSAAATYAFIQNGTKTLSQDITAGLSASTTYSVNFLAANRAGAPSANACGRVLIADASTTYYDSGYQVWGNAAFREVRGQFTTPGTIDGAVTITLSNNSVGGDQTVSYSNIVVDVPAANDPDNDGVLTADENSGAANGFDGAPTDPNDADSDDDGILDGEEGIAGVDGFVTNPNNANSDADPQDDALEIELGFDPTAADSPTTFASGNFVRNSDFVAGGNTFVFPGYGPKLIEGWNEVAGGIGINGGASGLTPFGDNGLTDGEVAFIQGAGELSSTITGTTASQSLFLLFDFNTRADNVGSGSATLEVFAGATSVFSQVVDASVEGAGSNTLPYFKSGVVNVTAPADAVWDLRFVWTVAAGDRTFLIDNVILSDVSPTEDRQWDNDQVTTDDQGLAGTFNFVNTNWWDGFSSVAWPGASTGTEIAIFAGTAGAVTLAETFTANQIDLRVDGYTFAPTAAEEIVFDGTDPTLDVDTGTATFNVPINAPAAALSKVGGGTAVLNGNTDLDSLLLTDDSGAVTVGAGATLANDAATAGNAFGVRLQDNTTLNVDGTLNVAGNFGGFSNDSDWTLNLNAGGALTVSSNVYVGWNAGATYNLNGGTSSVTGFLRHQDGGSPTITVGGGTHSVASLDAITNGSGSNTVFTQTGGDFTANTVLFWPGQAGAGPGTNSYTINLDGGTFTTDSITLTAGPSHNGSSDSTLALNLDGGTLRALSGGASTTLINGDLGNPTGTRSLSVTLDAGGGTIDTNGEDKSVDQAIGGAGALTKTGGGTLVVTAANTYTGATGVSSGNLLVNGDNSAATGAVNVAAGAGLGGDGTINDAVYAGGAKLPWTIADWNSGPTLDAGTVTTGDLEVVITEDALVNFSNATKTFTILSTTSLTVGGTLSVDASGFTSGSDAWSVAQNGNDIELTYTATIYGTWAALNGLTGPGADTSADTESGGTGDGLVQLLEIAFGTDPNAADNVELTVTNGTTFTAGTPRVQVKPASGASLVAYQFVRRKDHIAAGLTYTPKFTDGTGALYTDPANPVPTVISDAGGDYEVVEVRFPVFDSLGRKADALIGMVEVTLN